LVIKKGIAIFKAKCVLQAIKYLEDDLEGGNSFGGNESNDDPADEIWA
jgi:hypothetical protein